MLVVAEALMLGAELLDNVAVLVKLDPAMLLLVSTLTVMLPVPPDATLPTVQLIVPFAPTAGVVIEPVVTLAETKVVPAGSGSATVTPLIVPLVGFAY